MSEELLSHLRSQRPDDTKRWLLTMQSRGSLVTTEVNWWISLAQGAAFNAYLKPAVSREDQVAWAEVAIRTYDYIAAYINATSPHTYHISAMALRSVMIDRLEPQTHHFVLDPERIEHWFFDTITIPMEQARAIAQNIGRASHEEKTEMHHILDRLIPLQLLLEKGLIRRVDEVREWQHIRALVTHTQSH